jgi:hypothetical protein
MSTSTQNRKRAAVAAAATVAVGSGAATLAAESALANTYTKGFCQTNHLCEWSDGGFANNWKNWSSTSVDANYSNNNYDYLGFDSEHNLNDSISAVWNHSNRWAMLFRNDTYGSNRICFPPETAVRDLHVVKLEAGTIQIIHSGASWGNRVSSHQMYGSRPSDCEATGSTMVPPGQYGCSM